MLVEHLLTGAVIYADGRTVILLRMAIPFEFICHIFVLMQAREQCAAIDNIFREREAEAQRTIGRESAGAATGSAAAQGGVRPMGITD